MNKRLNFFYLVSTVLLFNLFFLSAPNISFAVESAGKVGSLNVFAKSGIFEILLDNQSVGNTPLKLDGIQAGTHYLKAVSEETIVQEEVIDVKEGEITSVVISPGGEAKKSEIRYVEVKKPEKPDYSEQMFRGPYLALGYLSSSYYSSYWYPSTYFDLSGSSIYYGFGYKYGFIPHVDVALEVSRSDLSKGDTNWYVMPISLNLSYSFGTQRKTEKTYLSFGLNKTLTNLSNAGTNLGSSGYSLIYGYEAPAWKDAVFYEAGWIIGNSSDVSSYIWLLRIGYRWNKGDKKEVLKAAK